MYRQFIYDRNLNCYNNLFSKYKNTFADLISNDHVINPLLGLKLNKWIINNEKHHENRNNYTKINNKVIVTNHNKNSNIIFNGKILMLMATLEIYFCSRKRFKCMSQAFSTWIRFNTNTIISTCIQKIFRGEH